MAGQSHWSELLPGGATDRVGRVESHYHLLRVPGALPALSQDNKGRGKQKKQTNRKPKRLPSLPSQLLAGGMSPFKSLDK